MSAFENWILQKGYPDIDEDISSGKTATIVLLLTMKI